MATLEELERRVSALEKAQNENTASLRWLLGTVAEIKATQDVHSDVLRDHTARLDKIEGQLEALPRIVAETVRDSETRILQAIQDAR